MTRDRECRRLEQSFAGHHGHGQSQSQSRSQSRSRNVDFGKTKWLEYKNIKSVQNLTHDLNLKLESTWRVWRLEAFYAQNLNSISKACKIELDLDLNKSIKTLSRSSDSKFEEACEIEFEFENEHYLTSNFGYDFEKGQSGRLKFQIDVYVRA